MGKQKYWKGIDQLENTDAYKKAVKDEFREDLPLVESLSKLGDEQKPRRDFLKMLGFSLGAATLAAGCEQPIRRAIPYAVQPEDIIPGIATFYASTFVNGSDFCDILVKTREGRPIKIEGNKKSSVTLGGTSARAQASVLGLYDNARLKGPKINGESAEWDQVDKEIKAILDRSNGGEITFLTSTILSPSFDRLLAAFKNRYPNTNVVSYEPVSVSGLRKANEATFGTASIPAYHFDKADTIVGIGCDFLGGWVSPTEFSHHYAKKRRISPTNRDMSRHYQFESRMSMTGSSADYRYSVKPSQEGQIAVALYKALGGDGPSVDLPANVQEGVKKAAADLRKSSGKSIVVSGVNDINVQTVVNGINQLLGNYGATLDFNTTYNTCNSDDEAMYNLVKDMNAKKIQTLFINNCNPVYDYFNAEEVVSGLQNVQTTISFNDREDETGEFVNYLLPDNHFLESWGDVEAKSGHYSIVQPTIAPLFNTRNVAESLMAWLGMEGDYYSFIKNNWQSNLISKQNKYRTAEIFWNASLHDGVFKATAGELSEDIPSTNDLFSGDASSAANKVVQSSNSGGVEVVFYEKPIIGNGKYANNPFLQETPDGISRVSWGNYAIVGFQQAKELGLYEGKKNDGTDLITLTVDGISIEVPIIIQPGQANGVISVALGYGRQKAGNKHSGEGANAYPMVSYSDGSFHYYRTNVDVKKTGSGYHLAEVQIHHTIDDRREIVKEASLKEYTTEPYAGNLMGKKLDDPHYVDHFVSTLYPSRDYDLKQGHHWGMAIDMNSCTGCGACVVACHVENNVPVVGRELTWDMKDMNWMRVDRYYKFDKETDPNAENPTVIYQPMMCQHCDNAPCENVCPVNATNHSTEGLNQMAYNRCIGTRYCANNCPFKVRRFNWFDYQGADSFYKKSALDNDEWVMTDDLMRMVLNPDVTVRSRGVMEKCSFCVQRIQEGKLTAKKQNRKLKDGDVVSACQTSCPTNAIMFGDMNDQDSEINQWIENERSYRLLEEINVMPSVHYLTKIRNVDEQVSEPFEYEIHHDTNHGGDDHGGHENDDHGKDSDAHEGHGH